MIDEREVLGQDEVTKLALAVVRGLKEPFTAEEAIAETKKAHRWAVGVRIDAALLQGVLTGPLGVKFKESDPEPKFFRLTDEAPGAVKTREPAPATDHVALMHSADVLIEERLESDGSASESWLVGAMLLRHPAETPEEIRGAVRDVFAARRTAEFAGTPADHLEHANELERYMDAKAAKAGESGPGADG